VNIVEIVTKNKLATLWFIFLVITFSASILVANPTMNPNMTGPFNYAQLQLQFSYVPENGMKVLESWGPGAAERYLSVIWIDVLFALSYGPFFYMLIKKLKGGLFWSIVPLLEMLTNLTETSLEIYWVINHTVDNQMFGLFLTHSIVASIKWLILVPIYLVHTTILLTRTFRGMNSPQMDEAKIERELVALLVEQFSVEERLITAQTSLADDLGADSVSLTETLARIEDRFKVRMPDFRFIADKRVGDVVKHVSAEMAKSPAAASAQQPG